MCVCAEGWRCVDSLSGLKCLEFHSQDEAHKDVEEATCQNLPSTSKVVNGETNLYLF